MKQTLYIPEGVANRKYQSQLIYDLMKGKAPQWDYQGKVKLKDTFGTEVIFTVLTKEVQA